MFGRTSTYIGVGNRSQSSLVLRGLTTALLALSLGGCAGLGLPFGEAGSGRLAAAKNTAKPMLASAVVVDNVDASDWETVRRTIAGAQETATSNLDWVNPDTGSTGSVTIAAVSRNGGSLCRRFATTVNDARGIFRYRGEACLRTDGRWQLRGMSPDDTTIS